MRIRSLLGLLLPFCLMVQAGRNTRSSGAGASRASEGASDRGNASEQYVLEAAEQRINEFKQGLEQAIARVPASGPVSKRVGDRLVAHVGEYLAIWLPDEDLVRIADTLADITARGYELGGVFELAQQAGLVDDEITKKFGLDLMVLVALKDYGPALEPAFTALLAALEGGAIVPAAEDLAVEALRALRAGERSIALRALLPLVAQSKPVLLLEATRRNFMRTHGVCLRLHMHRVLIARGASHEEAVEALADVWAVRNGLLTALTSKVELVLLTSELLKAQSCITSTSMLECLRTLATDIFNVFGEEMRKGLGNAKLAEQEGRLADRNFYLSDAFFLNKALRQLLAALKL